MYNILLSYCVCFIVCYYMFTRLDYSSALEYSIIRHYTNIIYYYYNMYYIGSYLTLDHVMSQDLLDFEI